MIQQRNVDAFARPLVDQIDEDGGREKVGLRKEEYYGRYGDDVLVAEEEGDLEGCA